MSNRKPKSILITFNKIGYACLEELISSSLSEIVTVYSISPENSTSISDYKNVSGLCESNNINLIYTKNINQEIDKIKRSKPDIIFIIGWSQIVKKELIEIPKYGCVGFHPALLPRNRGRAVMAWHFINNEKYGGATFFYIDEKCDHGNIIAQKKFTIEKKDNVKNYYEKAHQAAVSLFKNNLKNILNNTIKVRKQDHSQATYLSIRTKKDSYLDFNTLSARQLYNQIRAVAYIYPTAYVKYESNLYNIYESYVFNKNKSKKYYATPGQIISIKNNELTVKTIDGIIVFTIIKNHKNKEINYKKTFKAGHYFNI